ncbi:MAG: UvrD-helicase domain-containing protein, partial [Bacilli bacterium]
KQRLEVELNKRLKVDSNNVFLKKQLDIINDCYIMTFHALCMRLLSENMLDFQFDKPLVIADKIALETLKYQTYLTFYNNHITTKEFNDLDAVYNNYPLDITKLYEILNRTIDLSSSKSSLETFIETNKNQLLTFNSPFQYAPFNNILSEATKFYLDNIINTLSIMILNDDHEKLIPLVNDALLFFNELVVALNNQDYNTIYHNLSNYKLFNKPRNLQEHTKASHDYLKKEYLSKLSELYTHNQDDYMNILHNNQSNASIILKYALAFNQSLLQAKKEQGYLEFNDLEQYALNLLYDENDNFTNVAISLQQHFNEIMIDEYQDTNPIQEKIVLALSNQHNMFMVGDLKQSIYRFRNATSQLFTTKYYQYEKNDNGALINLSFNFRSKNEVLEMTNFIFKNTFSKHIGGIEYDDNAKLYFK